MKKKLTLIIITFVFTNLYSQKKVIVIDSVSHQPIPFVNIAFGKNNGVYTNEKGYFEVNENSNDTLFLKHISFNDFYIEAKKIKDTIILSQNAILLKEVIVSNKKRIIKYIDFPKRGGSYGSWPVTPKSEIISLIVPNVENINSIIKNFSISFLKKREENLNLTDKTAIRINIYTADKNKKIKKQIYSSNVFYINPNKKGKIELDIEKEEIELNKNGIFLGVEVLGDIDNKGNILKEKTAVHIALTENNTEDYSVNTYFKYVFERELILTNINDYLEKLSNKRYNKNISFSMTIYKPN